MGTPKKQSYWRIVARQFLRRPVPVVALELLVLLAGIALAAPFLAGSTPIYLVLEGTSYWFPNIFDYESLLTVDFTDWEPGPEDQALMPPVPYDPETSDLFATLQKPNAEHWLGTDDRGRDVLSRIIWGTRISMTVGFVAVAISVVIGLIVGCIGGYYGGKVDAVCLRLIEIMMCFPTLILILALVAFLPPSIYNIMAAIGVTSWTGVARLVRGEFLKLRATDFATAAKASGLSDARIIFRHLLPNALAPVLVSATFGVAGAILIESALSFLGFGVPPPAASWGEILKQAKEYVDFAYWLVIFPGLAVFITVTAFNLVGEGLRDAMDPRLRE